MTDPLSMLAGVVGVAAVGAQGLQTGRILMSDYRDAASDIKHVGFQRDLLHHLETSLKNELSEAHEKFELLQASLTTCSEKFPNGLRSDGKWARFRFAFQQKARATAAVTQFRDTEISAMVTLILELSRKLTQVQLALSQILEHHAILAELDLQKYLSYSSQRNRGLVAQVRNWHIGLCHWLGINACMIVTNVEGKGVYKWLVRVPTTWSAVFSGSLTTSWSSWASPSIHLVCRVQTVVPEDAQILEACRRDDVDCVDHLISSRGAHPNDITLDNFSILSIAIQSGSVRTTRRLLHYGADPNLVVGTCQTSPLSIAFHQGSIENAQALLQAGADIDYVNSRTWTCQRYIFDFEVFNNHRIELLDISQQNDFLDWNAQDNCGWTIFHRAAAYGNAEDLQKLLKLGVVSNMRTFTLNWLPIFCAVRHGNISTLKHLADTMPPRGLQTMTDSRGWTLLHLAAKHGSLPVIAELLDRGLDPDILSDMSDIAVPKGLEYVKATALDIARSCGHEEVYKTAFKAAAAYANVEARRSLSGLSSSTSTFGCNEK